MSAFKMLESVLAEDLSDFTIAVCLASMDGDAEIPTLQSLQMSRELAQGFKQIVTDYLGSIQHDAEQHDLGLKEYDAAYKPDSHEIEWVESADIEEVANSLGCIPNPSANGTRFDGNDNFIAGLHFYVIAFEGPNNKRLLFFRKYDPKKELTRSKWLAALFSDGTYDRIARPMFLFDPQIDCFTCGDFMFITHKHQFQQIFNFFAKVREKATVALQEIRAQVPIANFDGFAASCQSHLHKLTKLMNIAAKPYLKTVTMKDMKKTIKQFNLSVQIRKENGQEKLVFDPANRWEILKLLDDDYLGSVMTQLQYEVNSKRVM